MAFESADSGSQHSDSSSLVDRLRTEASSIWAQSSERAKMLASHLSKAIGLPAEFGDCQIMDNANAHSNASQTDNSGNAAGAEKQSAGADSKHSEADIAQMMFSPEWLPALHKLGQMLDQYRPYLIDDAGQSGRSAVDSTDHGVLIPTSPGKGLSTTDGAGKDASGTDAVGKDAADKDGKSDQASFHVYLGEGIRKDVSPKHDFPVSDGDTPESLAKMQLGKDASKVEISKYVQEMTHLNDLGNPARVTVGEKLNLPGHTADGGFITADENYTRMTVWPNGTHREQYADGHWVTHKPTRGGGYEEEHGGNSRPESNFVLVKTQDGRYYTTDQMDKAPDQWDKNGIFGGYQEIVGHKELDQLAQEKIKDPEQLAKFRADMARFEERMHYQDPDFTSLNCAGTYTQIERLLQAAGNQPLSADQRIELAQQVISQAATPTSIDQGGHSTCNVAALESRTYSKEPYEAAQMVADAALTGQYKAQDGTVVKLDPHSLQPDGEAKVNPPQDGMRSYASQIFQVTAANIGIEQENQKSNPPRQWRYEQHTDGERLIDYGKNPPVEVTNNDVPVRAPNLRDDQIVAINSAITGESKFDDVLIAHKGDNIGPGTGVTRIGSESELNDKLAQIAKDGKLPVIIQVDAKAEPFFSDNNNSSSSQRSAETHVVTITGFEAGPPAKVSIDGQWGSKSDHAGAKALSVHDLYLAMRSPSDSPEEMQQLKADVQANQGKPTADVKKEFELTRFEEDANDVKSQYDTRVAQSMRQAQQRWGQAHSDKTAIDADTKKDHDRDIHAFMLMIKELPQSRQQAIIDQVEAAGDDQDLRIQITKMQAMQRTASVGVMH